MEIVVLVAHPRPESFNHAIAARAVGALRDAGHQVHAHDLYAERFDPVLRPEECFTTGSSIEALMAAADDPLVRLHRRRIASADGLVVVHPNWWGKPPAILAGWLDRVLVPGVAYRLADATARPEGLLALGTAVVVNTSDTLADRERDDLGDPLDAIWRRCVLPYCGAGRVERLVIGPVTESTAAERQVWLEAIDALVLAAFSPTPV